MKRSLLSLALITQLLGGAASADPLDWGVLYDGLEVARENTEPGVLGSAVKEPWSLYYQNLLDQVESKVYGLTLSAREAAHVQAEKTYYVESVALGLLRELLNDTNIKSAYERESLQYRALSIYEDARVNGERLFEIMIRRIDRAAPGTSGIQLPKENANGSVVYTPNYRFENKLTRAERSQLYADKLKEFTSAGGSLDEVKLFDLSEVDVLPSKAIVEFVAMPDGEIRFTQGKAGHILMARGKVVSSAGTMLILKDRWNRPEVVVVSNSSGSFKPDMMPVEDIAEKIGLILGIPHERVKMTKGEPTTTQTLKILLKTSGLHEDSIKTIVDVVKRDGEIAQSNPAAFVPTREARSRACRALF